MLAICSRVSSGSWIVRTHARESLEEACESHGLKLGDLRHFVVHPGEVLEAYEDALGLELGSLDLPREVLREYGNMSSVSVLFVLEHFLEEYPAKRKEYGTISALGPGFPAEHVLLATPQLSGRRAGDVRGTTDNRSLDHGGGRSIPVSRSARRRGTSLRQLRTS